MSQLGNVLVTGSLILVALVVIGGVLQASNFNLQNLNFSTFEELLEVSLSMAVAVVPEGLPAVITVTLALGTQRMVRRHALIRKLPAVETLGSVTTICSDKTGTLTQNKMVVQSVYTNNNLFHPTGEGYAPIGEFQLNGQRIETDDYLPLQALLIACALCNDSTLQEEKGQWIILGDPTEGALLTLAAKAGVEKDQWSTRLPRVAEFPFSSERKRMSVICEVKSEQVRSEEFSQLLTSQPQYVMFTKGSPELTLARCTRINVGDRAVPLNDAQRQEILTQNDSMASRGLRVLGFAYKLLNTLPPEGSQETSEQELVWLGLVGMLDAPDQKCGKR